MRIVSMRHAEDARGFTLIELGVVVVCLSLVFAFAVPSYQSFNQTLQLQGSAQSLAAQINMARQKAINTGAGQTIHFYYGTYGFHYHIHNAGVVGAGWNFPNGVLYSWDAGTLPGQQVTMQPNGRASQSGMVILTNPRGQRDTVRVQLSGMVLVD